MYCLWWQNRCLRCVGGGDSTRSLLAERTVQRTCTSKRVLWLWWVYGTNFYDGCGRCLSIVNETTWHLVYTFDLCCCSGFDIFWMPVFVTVVMFYFLFLFLYYYFYYFLFLMGWGEDVFFQSSLTIEGSLLDPLFWERVPRHVTRIILCGFCCFLFRYVCGAAVWLLSSTIAFQPQKRYTLCETAGTLYPIWRGLQRKGCRAVLPMPSGIYPTHFIFRKQVLLEYGYYEVSARNK